MENASTEVYLIAHSALVKERVYHIIVVLFTIEIMDADKPVLVVNIPPVRFICGATKQVR